MAFYKYLRDRKGTVRNRVMEASVNRRSTVYAWDLHFVIVNMHDIFTLIIICMIFYSLFGKI